MTLDESKMTKRMRVEGWIDGQCLNNLWFTISIFPGLSIEQAKGNRRVLFQFDGLPKHGEYIVGEITKAHRGTKRSCRIEISHYYA